MQFKFACPKCATRVEAEALWSGSFAECPHCGTSVHVPEPRIGPDTTIGGFRLERLLGRGGMGEVYLATQLSMDRQVAVKILPRALTSNRAFVDRFLLEVRTAAKLEHPNIVTAFDAGEDSGIYYLAMGYVDGESLDEKLKRDGPFSETEVLRIALKLSRALGYAWEHVGVLHRDIKPANIMLDRFGEAKLMDLGVAKMAGEDTGLTITGVALGTPSYMSPEQARGAADLDCRSDIYSLGCCMYQLLAGRAPYSGRNPLEVISRHLTAPVPSIRSDQPQVSLGCEALLRHAMAKDRRKRPRSWAVMAAEISAVLAGRPLPAAATQAPGRGWVVAGVTVLALVLVAEVAAVWVLTDPSRFRRATSLVASIRSRWGPGAPVPARPAPAIPPFAPAAPGPAPAAPTPDTAAVPAAGGPAVVPSAATAALNSAMDHIADLILDCRLAEASSAWSLECARLKPFLGAERTAALDDAVARAIRQPEQIAESFRASIGKEVTVVLREGARVRAATLTVEAVDGLRVSGTSRRSATPGKESFEVRDLDLDEQLCRLDLASDPSPELTRGVAALASSRIALATASFRRAEHPLGDALLVAMERRRLAAADSLPRPDRRLRDWQPVQPRPSLEASPGAKGGEPTSVVP